MSARAAVARPGGSVLARYLRPQARRMAILAGFLLAGIATQLLSPLIVRRFIDTAAVGGAHASLTALWVLAGAFIAAAIVTQLLQIGATYHSEQLAWAATNALRRDLATHALGLDMKFHNATSPGDLIERVDGDVAALANFFSQFVLQIVGGALLLAGILLVLLLQDWRIGLALGAVGVVTGLTMHAMRDLARDQWERVRNAFSAFSAFLEERVAGLEDIRANGGGAHAMRRFAELNRELAASNIAAIRRGQWIYLVASGLFSLGFAVALAVGARLFQLHAVTIGAVFMFVQYTGMMAQPIVLIGTQLQQFQTASASLTRIRGLLALGPELIDGPGVGWGLFRQRPPRVAFEHVDFAYRSDAPVLRDVSLTLEPGMVLGLLGRTGSGKTTLTRLLFRLYDPVGGRVALDGEDIRGATLAELRSRIGLVTQEVQLFDASVRDNATLFDPTIPDTRIIDVLTDLGLGDWLARQPQGLSTVMAAGGGLSAGEAQLLAFARVFLKDPGLILLDEASSRLDPASDRLIERALDKLLGADGKSPRRTTIIIAHKLSTVDRADRIAILDGGRVLETGGRAALAADPGSAFARLLATGAEEALA
ncbi:MAG TPA: ABC transporter ATP-binding protein [Caulobacteraceae bacterium]|nr:ABC transporter ATP-binding protein [Caulobacteraceae bacterium]